MTLPTYVGAGAVASSAGAAITPALPTGWQANDIFFILQETSGLQTTDPVPPTGWAQIANSPIINAGSYKTRLSVFWRRAVAGDTAPTLASVTDHQIAQCVAFRGCPTSGDPWDSTISGKTDTLSSSFSASGLTTAGSDRLALIFGSQDYTGSLSGWANADLVNVLERVDATISLGDDGGIFLATGEKAIEGAFGNTTATATAAAAFSWITMALKSVEEVVAETSNKTPLAFMPRGLKASLGPFR